MEMRLASIEAGHRQALRDSELDASNEEGGGGGLRPQTRAVVVEARLWLGLFFCAVATSQFSLDRSWGLSQATRLESFSR